MPPLVLLADQPLVRLEVLACSWPAGARASARWSARATPDAPDEPGHPVLADRSLWPLAARSPATRLRQRSCHPARPGVALIEVAGRNPDIDTPDDLTTLEGPSS